MAYNFLGLVNKINQRLNEVELSESNFDSAIGFYSTSKSAINSAIRDINQQEFEWPFNHDTQDTYLDTGKVRHFIPNDAKTVDMDSFRLKRSDSLGVDTRKLKVISYEDYLEKYVDAEYNSNLTGVPEFVFRTPSQEFGVYPAPDKDYPIVYEYYRLPVDLLKATDAPQIPEQFSNVILEGAMYHVYLFRGEESAASASLERFKDGLKYMRSLYINRYSYVRSTVIER